MQAQTHAPTGDDATQNRRILLCAIGMSPQIVTETLYALAVRPAAGSAPWTPTDVHIITTEQGAHNAKLTLLSGQPGWFHQLRRDFDLPPIAFDERNVHVITSAGGEALEDIRSPSDNEAAADQIARLVRDLASDREATLHASLAGGRKTMSYYLGYAMSLFGRPQDKLSHVLVSSDFESHPEFFYPTPYERVIHTRNHTVQRALNCADAEVHLAEIPFLRLRDALPQRLLGGGSVGFSDAVRRADLSVHPATITLETQRRVVLVSGEPVDLTPTHFVLYAWMVWRHQEGAGDFDPSDFSHASAFLAFARQTLGDMDGTVERLEDNINSNIRQNAPDVMKQYFAPMISRINKLLDQNLGLLLAQRCKIESHGKRGDKRYALPQDLIIG